VHIGQDGGWAIFGTKFPLEVKVELFLLVEGGRVSLVWEVGVRNFPFLSNVD